MYFMNNCLLVITEGLKLWKRNGEDWKAKTASGLEQLIQLKNDLDAERKGERLVVTKINSDNYQLLEIG